MINDPAITQFVSIHKKNEADGIRLGQRFCNLYLKDAECIPGLYYQQNEALAINAIYEWLEYNQYFYELPPYL